MGVPYVLAKGVGVSRARYFPGATKTHVKLLAEPGTLRLIGGQIHGGEGVKERCDFLAFAAKRGATLEDLAWMENIYSPPIGALFEPIAIAAQNGLAELAQGEGIRAGAGMTAAERMQRRLRAQAEHHLRVAAMKDLRAPAPRGHGRAGPRPRRRVLAGGLRPGLPAPAVGGQAARDEGAADDGRHHGWTAPERRPGEPWRPPPVQEP